MRPLMTNNQSNELEDMLLDLLSESIIYGEELHTGFVKSKEEQERDYEKLLISIDAIKMHCKDRERQARIETIADVKKAGYGYDDGTGFVLKISYKELGQLKGDKS